jgi:uncharacterized membrane protein YphA (DoxX/SURF4 family)
MSLLTLVLIIAAVAVLLTAITWFGFGARKNLLMSYLQNFTGALFVFSGWVKAIDPLGTAYKMEQYFAEFEATFADTWMSFLAPVFPWLSSMSVGFSVFMIIFEIVLGLMLIMGARPKFTAWAFFLLVFFFTFLTGFTYLTGYVPSGVNFFQFGSWGAFAETNMRVTDCGCFGDFIKLKPKTSFLKDVFLLIPAFFFLIRSRDMHQLFSRGMRDLISVVAIAGLLIYCFSNYVWNLPHTDFRPFREGVNIRAQKDLEREAQENVELLAYKMTNKASGEVVELPYDDYLKEYKNYPKEEWTLEQIKSKPAIEPTKISDFEVSNLEGYDITEDILMEPGYSLMIIAHKIPYERATSTRTLRDSVFVTDTVTMEGIDSTVLVRRFDRVEEKQIQDPSYSFPDWYKARYTKALNGFLAEAEAAGVKVFAITGYADAAMIDDFRHQTQSAYPFHVADDILLKTIIRSNPGIVLLRDGEVLRKWHIRKLPKSFSDLNL